MAFNGPYPTVFSGHTAAMVISHTTFGSGVTNTGTIGTGGISVISGAFISGGGILDTGTIAGGIRVDSSSKIVASGGNNAIAVENTRTFGGGITNAGTISGHRAISISNVAIFGGPKAGGGITNRGTISALETAVLVQGITSFSGGINNSGTISTGPDITGIEISEVAVASGGITNSGTIRAGTGIALYVVSTFAGNITNAKSGTISAGTNAGIQVGFISVGQNSFVSSFTGSVINSGTITAKTGINVLDSTIHGAIVDAGTIFASKDGIRISSGGVISGGVQVGSQGAVSAGSHAIAVEDPTVPNGGSVVASATGTFPRSGIDLPDIAFGAQTTLAYAENAAGTGGTLTVSDGRHAAAIALLGSYIAGSFVLGADGQGGTLIMRAQPNEQTLLAPPRN